MAASSHEEAEAAVEVEVEVDEEDNLTLNSSGDWSSASVRGTSCTTRDMTIGGGSNACK